MYSLYAKNGYGLKYKTEEGRVGSQRESKNPVGFEG